jgi:hypothetical protein
MQNHYNLIYREEEREMMPLCTEEGIAVTPYSPLASGRLARPWAESTERFESDPIAKMKYNATADTDKLVVGRVAEIAEKYAVPFSSRASHRHLLGRLHADLTSTSPGSEVGSTDTHLSVEHYRHAPPGAQPPMSITNERPSPICGYW